MPRIRTIKPEFWDSPGTARASLRGRLFFIAMWNWADDYGFGTANAKQLVSFAFPNDPDVSAEDFPSLCKEVSDCFGVEFYTVNSRPYFAIPSWDKHQKTERRAKPRIPSPDQGEPQNLGTSFPSQGSSGVGTGEREQGKGNRGKTTERDEPPDRAPQVVNEPAHIDNPAKPTKRTPSSSAMTVVRQELGNAGYPRPTLERLAVQAEKLFHDKHPDNLIRASLREWDQRPNCDKPEFLPTVLGDLVKKSRSSTTGLTPGEAKVLGWAALGQPDQPDRKSLE